MGYASAAYGTSPYAGQAGSTGSAPSGTSVSTSSAQGILSVAVALTGTSQSTSRANGSLPGATPVALTGSSASNSSATGALTMLLTGQSGGASKAWATESTVQVISADGTFSVSGAVAFTPHLAFTAAGTWTAIGDAALAASVPAPTIPTGVTAPMIWQVSPVMGAPTLTNGVPTDWTPTSVTVQQWGYLQAVIDNKDATFLRNTYFTPYTFTFAMPGSDETAELRFPQVTPFDTPGSGDLSMLVVGANVDLRRVDPNNMVTVLWEGWFASEDVENDEHGTMTYYAVQCSGVLRQALLSVQNPKLYQLTVDTGTRMAAALDDVIGRRYTSVAPVNTGEPITVRGSRSQSRYQFLQQMTSNSTTASGDAYTVTNSPGRVGKIRLISSLTTTWTISAGAPGVTLRLSKDITVTPNVVYIEGTDPGGAWWGRSRYPNTYPDDGLAWCGTTISQGTTDAQTTSGTGVTDAQYRLMVTGYGGQPSGTFTADDVTHVKWFQSFAGLTVNGTLDQTAWDALFAAGSAGSDATAAYFAPGAWDTKVEPYIYHADGSVKGPNPNYDPTVMRVEVYQNYGEGVSLAQGVTSAQAQLTRVPSAGWSGTILLTSDPEEGSKLEIRDGHLINVKYLQGSTATVRVSKVRHDLLNQQTTLTVDAYNRDAMTMGAVINRNWEALQDPSATTMRRRLSRSSVDQVVQFDGEGGAGVIPRIQIPGGAWTVLPRVPTGTTGRMVGMAMAAGTGLQKYTVKTNFNAPFGIQGGGVAVPISGPVKFAVLVFDSQVTANAVASWVGNPFASSAPFDTYASALLNAGFLTGWGSSSEAPGYYPNTQAQGGALTGYFFDGGGFQYQSGADAWLWVAVYPVSTCYVEGRMWAAVPSF